MSLTLESLVWSQHLPFLSKTNNYTESSQTIVNLAKELHKLTTILVSFKVLIRLTIRS